MPNIADTLWSELSQSKTRVTMDSFRKSFRTCRINSLLQSSSSVSSSDVFCYDLSYDASNSIRLNTTTVFPSALSHLGLPLSAQDAVSVAPRVPLDPFLQFPVPSL